MALSEEINLMAREIHTDGYPMSIGEIASLYKTKNSIYILNFKGYSAGQSYKNPKLIESILLGIPIPSIFVSQRDDGVWDVVDGLQRLSTIFDSWGFYEMKMMNYSYE